MKLISKGAEAEIYKKEDCIIKKRIKKNYRIAEIDDFLRKFRTKREAKIIFKALEKKIPVPCIYETDSEKCIIKLKEIKGSKLRDKISKSNYAKLCKEVGTITAKLHNSSIIHGDLTTSNMIYSNNEKKIFFIDFGLGFFSEKIEDKAVDIHLFKQALASKHNKFSEEGFKQFLKGYKKYSTDYDAIIKRLQQVESRGRNKKRD